MTYKILHQASNHYDAEQLPEFDLSDRPSPSILDSWRQYFFQWTWGYVVYEVKNFSPRNSSDNIMSRALEGGVIEVLDRFQFADAGVLTINDQAWKKVYPSRAGEIDGPTGVLYPMENHRNYNNQQNGFLRIEKGLYTDTQDAYRYFVGKLRNIPLPSGLDCG